MGIRDAIRKIVFGHKANSKLYIEYLRKIGVRVGEHVTIYTPTKTTIDESYPWMLTIGNNVKIAQGAIILNHDYSWSVLKGVSGAILGASGKVTIGDNVFIGMNAIITRNVRIGNNVVIGAGSVVTKDCLDNGVYAGNPAIRIAELDDFLEKRKQQRNLLLHIFSATAAAPLRKFSTSFSCCLNVQSLRKRSSGVRTSCNLAETLKHPFYTWKTTNHNLRITKHLCLTVFQTNWKMANS